MLWAQKTKNEKKYQLPRDIRIRPGTENDEVSSFEVMRRSMGFEMAWDHHEKFRHHLRKSQGCSFWLAEEQGRFGKPKTVGYARCVVRDRVLCITEFFVLPGYHRRGIGGSLLSKCIEEGASVGVDTHLVLASHHPGANSLYIRKLNCTPRVPMMLLAGPLSRLRTPKEHFRPVRDTLLPFAFPPLPPLSPELDYILVAEPILLTPEIEERMEVLDREIVGYGRKTDHRQWGEEMGGIDGASRLFRKAKIDENGKEQLGEIVAYGYLGSFLSGPALALNSADLPAILSHISALARTKINSDDELDFIMSSEQYWAIAGTNETTLRWLLECGWEITFHYLFMSSRPLGRLENYVCHNPLYVL